MSVRFRPIQLLSVALRNQIAAGEVVERPASAVKELVENSLDAGASQIDIRLDNGGRDLIRVQDNGCGIPKDALELAVTRHATSKIARFEDLETLTSLGFRGEALPSIASVSRFTLNSAYDGESYALDVTYGILGDCTPTALPQGTVVSVRELFGSTPARLKFLKKPTTEFKRAEEIFLRIALANCAVGFTFASGERTLHTFLPGESVQTRLKAFWPTELVETLLPFALESGSLRVHGLAAPPTLSQVRANHIYLYVNGRAVHDKRLLGAIKDAYKGKLITREYPQCVLFLEIDPHDVDVNVHPAKAEVRFQDESAVFRACLRAVQQAISTDPLCQQMTTSRATESFSAQRVDTQREDTQRRDTQRSDECSDQGTDRTDQADFVARPKGFWGSLDTMPIFSKKQQDDIYADVSAGIYADIFQAEDRERACPEDACRASDGEAKQNTDSSTTAFSTTTDSTTTGSTARGSRARESLPAGLRYLGQIAHTYLVFENAEHALVLLDQHAAHERVLYERFLAHAYAGKAQMLMVPLEVPLARGDSERLYAVRETLTAMGYTLSIATDHVNVRSIPPMLPLPEAKDFLQGVVKDRLDDSTAIFKRMACRAAIKAGQQLSFEDVLLLVTEWYATENRDFCPHGRPTVLVWDVGMLEKAFKRV